MTNSVYRPYRATHQWVQNCKPTGCPLNAYQNRHFVVHLCGPLPSDNKISFPFSVISFLNFGTRSAGELLWLSG